MSLELYNLELGMALCFQQRSQPKGSDSDIATHVLNPSIPKVCPSIPKNGQKVGKKTKDAYLETIQAKTKGR